MIGTLLFLGLLASGAVAGPVLTEEAVCSLCRTAVRDVKEAVSDQQLHAQVLVKLEEVCDVVGAFRREECAAVLSGLSQEVLGQLLHHMEPTDLCVAMTACPAPVAVQIPRRSNTVQRRGDVEASACQECEALVKFVDQLLKNRTDPAAVNKTVLEICHLLPQQFQQICEQLAPELVLMIVNGVDPVGACTNIGLCLAESAKHVPSESLRVSDKQIQLPSSTPECVLCEFLVQAVDQYLQENTTEAAINATLTIFCRELPSPLNTTCLTFAPQIVQRISQGVDPAQTCTQLRLCSNATEHVMAILSHTLPVRKVELPSNTVECELCELLVQTVDQYLQENSTKAAINATVYKLCNDLTDTVKTTCLALAPTIVDKIIGGLDPAQGCTEIGLCTNTTVMQPKSLPLRQFELPSDTVPCELCELVVQTVDQYLQENSTEAAINATVYGLCNDLPAQIKSMCLTLAPQIVKTIVQGVDPQTACTDLGLCTSAAEHASARQPKSLHLKQVELPSDTVPCELCELVVQTVDQYLQENSTEAAINATVYSLCNALPADIKSTCLTLAPAIVNKIVQGVDPPQACAELGLCTNTTQAVHSPKRELPSSGPVCELCEVLVKEADRVLKENRTESFMNATSYRLCSTLPEPYTDWCLSYWSQVIAMLSQGVDPAQVCTKLCAEGTEHVLDVRSKSLHAAGKQAEHPSNTVECELCELVVQTVDQYLKENKTEAAINATVYKLCNALPADIKPTCYYLAPLFMEEISLGVDPAQACAEIGLCTNTTGVHVWAKKAKRLSAGPACEVCELVVQTVDQYLKENKTEAAINATVYNLCNGLPASIKPTCLSLAPLVVSTLSKGVDPQQACTAIKLCTASGVESSPPKAKLAPNPLACELCELVVSALDHYLKENRSEAAINATVYKLCNDLPGDLKATCLQFAPEVVKILSQGVDPKQACTAIGLCTASDVKISPPKVQLAPNPVACELCELVVGGMDQLLKKNKTEAAINATVYGLCNDLSGASKTLCLKFAPEVVHLLFFGVDPKYACTVVGVCPWGVNRSSPKVKRVSANPEECELCELVVQTVDQYLQENSTKAAINATVYGLCNALPADIKDTCIGLAPKIVHTLSEGVDPKQACTAIHLCNATASGVGGGKAVVSVPVVARRVVKKESVPELRVDWCVVCKDHIGIIDQDLYREEKPLNDFLDGVCHRLPPPTDQACLTAADTKFPEIWESFLNGTGSAENICKLLEVCPS